MKITCPNCHRILGDTEKNIDANLNCRGCKKTVAVKIRFAKMTDYLSVEKGENNVKQSK